MSVYTNPEEFKLFHKLLMADAPEGFQPFYFPLEKNGKDPLKGNSWKNNRKTYTEAYNLMKSGFNVGIAATDKDSLVIVDIDDLSQVKDPKPTLMNVSRKRIGRHCFYFTSDTVARTIFDNSAKQNIATEEAGEVRSVWQYVVSAGSYVPVAPEELDKIPEHDKINAGKYTVMAERSVTSITYDELPDVYRTCLQNKRAVDISNRQKQKKKPMAQDKDSKNKSALWNLTIYDVTGKRDDPTHRFTSPFHGSKTNANASVSNGMLHCWRHNVSHNALTYLACEAGVSNCSGAGFGHNGSGSSDVDFDDPATIYKLWTYAKNHGFIPDSDPMPTKAMVYYATQEKLCTDKEVVDGWKLPRDVYNEIVTKAPFTVGRDPLKAKTEKIGQAIQGSMINPLQIALSLQEHIPIYYDPAKNYWMWNDELKKYDRVDETEILVQISSSMDLTIYRSKIKQEILEAIRLTGRKRRVQPTKKEWIQFENKVVNIETLETFEATPDYFFVSPIPHKLGESEELPTIDSLFHSWQDEKAALLYEICSYCMYDDYPIQRIFAFIGVGSNGKGQFMTLMRRLLGTENCVSTDLDRLSKSNFESSKLYKKKAAFIGETNYTLSRTSMLKALSGGDLVSAEFKGRDSFDFINTAKIIIATNGLPTTTDRSIGFYRRWCLLEFKNSFTDGKSIVDTIPETEYENLCYKCVKLLQDIILNGKLKHEENLEQRKEKYEALSNPVQAFLDEECELIESEKVPAWFLYDMYEIYREKRGHRKITKHEFGSLLKEMGYESFSEWYTKEEVADYSQSADITEGKNWKSYLGVTFSPQKKSVRNENIKPVKAELLNSIPNQPNQPNQEISSNYYRRKTTENEVRTVRTVRNENTPNQPNQEINSVNVSQFDNENSVSLVSNVINPYDVLDSLILDEVKNVYHGIVKDDFEFEREFCKKIPIFKGSMVKDRMVLLRRNGFKRRVGS